VPAKHSKSFSLVDAISVSMDRMQRNFDPCGSRSNSGANRNSPTFTAKMIIYQAFNSAREFEEIAIGGDLGPFLPFLGFPPPRLTPELKI